MEWTSRFQWKRCLDIVVVVLASPFALMITIIVYALMYSFYEGDVLYKQQRVGYKGKVFTLLKFRTMFNGEKRNKIDAETQLNGEKLKNDPRVFFLGKLMRFLSIDELPQLINVLKGEMSMVGPRPLQPFEVAGWEEKFGKEKIDLRHSVPPGLSGRAQTHGRDANSIEQKLEYDLEYIEVMSFWRDLRTIVRTLLVLPLGTNAY